MVQYKTEALVLFCRPYREADGLVTLLTRDQGKVSALARGIYKTNSKLRSGVMPYSYNVMQVNAGKGSLHTLLQSECLEMFLPLRQDLMGLSYGAYWSELLVQFSAEGQQDQQLFRLALSGFHALSLQPSVMMMLALEIRLLEQAGYQPVLEECVLCGGRLSSGARRLLSPEAGGVVCGDCPKTAISIWPSSPGAISLWGILGRMPLERLQRIQADSVILSQLSRLVRRWIQYQAGKPMKSWQVLKNMEVFENDRTGKT